MDVEKAQDIAESFVKANPNKLGKRFKELAAEQLVPNSTIKNKEYWEFWLVQEDSKLINTEFTRSLGINLGDVLTFAGKPPSILLSKLRVNKVCGEVEVVNLT
ncbi:hypothetical protein [Hahella chejuensis]|uniref:hypothetical protein n=1 Tax=Hahella chejuensis TaxID=158327 RepID=UPI0005A191F6|nr:hypothetical protein [Hahella chejuensis]